MRAFAPFFTRFHEGVDAPPHSGKSTQDVNTNREFHEGMDPGYQPMTGDSYPKNISLFCKYFFSGALCHWHDLQLCSVLFYSLPGGFHSSFSGEIPVQWGNHCFCYNLWCPHPPFDSIQPVLSVFYPEISRFHLYNRGPDTHSGRLHRRP